jgi:hypothetical protein
MAIGFFVETETSYEALLSICGLQKLPSERPFRIPRVNERGSRMLREPKHIGKVRSGYMVGILHSQAAQLTLLNYDGIDISQSTYQQRPDPFFAFCLRPCIAVQDPMIRGTFYVRIRTSRFTRDSPNHSQKVKTKPNTVKKILRIVKLFLFLFDRTKIFFLPVPPIHRTRFLLNKINSAIYLY